MSCWNPPKIEADLVTWPLTQTTQRFAYIAESADWDVLQSSWEKCYMTSWQYLSFILRHFTCSSQGFWIWIYLKTLKCYTTERMYSKPNEFVIEQTTSIELLSWMVSRHLSSISGIKNFGAQEFQISICLTMLRAGYLYSYSMLTHLWYQ